MSFARYLRHLVLGLMLIAAAASVLLFSDWSQRRTGPSKIPHIAVLQHAVRFGSDQSYGVDGDRRSVPAHPQPVDPADVAATFSGRFDTRSRGPAGRPA